MSGNTVPVCWFENERGERRDMDADDPTWPAGYRYMHYRNPLELHDRITTIEGATLGVGCETYPASLVLALTRPTVFERLVSILRFGWPGPTYPLDQAILRAASCERCMNAQAYRAGLLWGYRRGGAEWRRSRTRCELCEHEDASPWKRTGYQVREGGVLRDVYAADATDLAPSKVPHERHSND